MKREVAKAFGLFVGGLFVVMLVLWGLGRAQAQDKPDGSWWQRSAVRACGSAADALWADQWAIEGDNIRATVTGGGPSNHDWAPIGREYIVPRAKWLDEPGNPTGRPMIFISRANLDHVYCLALGPMI